VCNEGFVEREFSTRAIIHVEPGKDRLDKPLLGKPEGTCNLVSTDLRSEQHGRFLESETLSFEVKARIPSST
jgi:hypothetical protein